MRPSELFGITWPLAAFYLDRGLYRWSNFVENKLNEVEATVRNQMKNQAGTDAFVQSSKTAMYNKLMGLSVATAYRQPGLFGKPKETPKAKSPAPQPVTVSGEKFDLSVFNG